MLKLNIFPSGWWGGGGGGGFEVVGVVMKSRTLCNNKSCLVHPIQHYFSI